jgi:hypothetical protein
MITTSAEEGPRLLTSTFPPVKIPLNLFTNQNSTFCHRRLIASLLYVSATIFPKQAKSKQQPWDNAPAFCCRNGKVNLKNTSQIMSFKEEQRPQKTENPPSI